MADHTKIEWTDATWNPITGCSIISPGCTHCYAMKLAGTRLKHHPSRTGLTRQTKAGPVWNGEVRFNEGWLTQPLQWKRPRLVFVCAHGDLFHEDVPDEWIDKVFAVMALAHQHTFQVLTKRSERMRDYLSRHRWHLWAAAGREIDPQRWQNLPPIMGGDCTPVPNVWLGVSAEDQRRADERIPDLLATPAAIRFVSAEPLLGPIDFRNHRVCGECENTPFKLFKNDPFCPEPMPVWDDQRCPLHWWPSDGCDGTLRSGIDLIIGGGENGPRPMHPDWARQIRDQCAASDTAFFFKQWGSFAPDDRPHPVDDSAPIGSFDVEDDQVVLRRDASTNECWYADEPDSVIMRLLGKKAAGRLLDGVEHNAMPRTGR